MSPVDEHPAPGARGVTLFLRDDIKDALDSAALGPVADAFDALYGVQGTLYRRTRHRRTLRVAIAGRIYFAKLHDGAGWREVLKNLMQLKLPILGAENEYAACRHLAQANISAPRVAAYGRRGWNPVTRRSFSICDAFEGYVSLEEVAHRWRHQPPSLRLRRALLRQVALFTRALHAAGVNHRDYYLCHLLADADRLAQGDIRLAVIDLHRAGVRRRVPRRWLRRDLAALLYSAAQVGLSRRDWFRFVRDYAAMRPAAAIRNDRALWDAVVARAERLLRRGRRDTAAQVS